jgi:predicted AAA+ superfamily ATPase
MVVKTVLAAVGDDIGEDFSRMVGLDITFGGGKTHNLIDSYHLVEHRDAIGNLADFIDESLAARLMKVDRPFRRTVIDEEDISTTEAPPTVAANYSPMAQRGKLVYQLLGLEAYH